MEYVTISKSNIIGFTSAIAIVLFGMRTESSTWNGVGILIATIVFILLFFRRKILTTTRLSLWLYTLLSFLIFLSTIYGSIINFSLRAISFAGIAISGLLWLVIGSEYGKKEKMVQIVLDSVVFAGFILLTVFILSIIFGFDEKIFGYQSMVYYASGFRNHNHIGDFLILTMLVIWQKKYPFWLVIPFGVLTIMSQSRSALIGLMVGVGYALYNRKLSINFKKMVPLSILFIIIFVIMSYGKSTIRSRDYYIEAVAAIIQHPLGFGYGNFDVISINPRYHVLGATGFSTYAHSIIFEWLGGIGWAGLLGVGWLILIAYRMGTKTVDKQMLLLRSLWWAMLVPMMLDSVYVVPSYWWLWMLITGMSW